MGKVDAVKTQLVALDGWIGELSEHFDERLDRIVPFDYSPSLRAALDLHGLTDPHMAWTVFCERADALSCILDRLSTDQLAR